MGGSGREADEDAGPGRGAREKRAAHSPLRPVPSYKREERGAGGEHTVAARATLTSTKPAVWISCATPDIGGVPGSKRPHTHAHTHSLPSLLRTLQDLLAREQHALAALRATNEELEGRGVGLEVLLGQQAGELQKLQVRGLGRGAVPSADAGGQQGDDMAVATQAHEQCTPLLLRMHRI